MKPYCVKLDSRGCFFSASSPFFQYLNILKVTASYIWGISIRIENLSEKMSSDPVQRHSLKTYPTKLSMRNSILLSYFQKGPENSGKH